MYEAFFCIILPFDVGTRKQCCMGLCTNSRGAGQANEIETKTDWLELSLSVNKTAAINIDITNKNIQILILPGCTDAVPALACRRRCDRWLAVWHWGRRIPQTRTLHSERWWPADTLWPGRPCHPGGSRLKRSRTCRGTVTLTIRVFKYLNFIIN